MIRISIPPFATKSHHSENREQENRSYHENKSNRAIGN